MQQKLARYKKQVSSFFRENSNFWRKFKRKKYVDQFLAKYCFGKIGIHEITSNFYFRFVKMEGSRLLSRLLFKAPAPINWKISICDFFCLIVPSFWIISKFRTRYYCQMRICCLISAFVINISFFIRFNPRCNRF